MALNRFVPEGREQRLLNPHFLILWDCGRLLFLLPGSIEDDEILLESSRLHLLFCVNTLMPIHCF